ncbi:unnamed protein product, partial [Mesorhabditis belari]|uniref:Uncharacterized protein n=1 Tax=Mesorhabditis belari TaxID=2138241 RepID=A0AAF3FLX5_9BILA
MPFNFSVLPHLLKASILDWLHDNEAFILLQKFYKKPLFVTVRRFIWTQAWLILKSREKLALNMLGFKSRTLII